YDDLLSDIFLRIFSVSPPMLNLGVGSGSQGYQTAEIITRLEKVLLNKKPDLVLVPGDTNSALASALAAVKLRIRVAHIEAGARSYNMEMQEEINRRVIDHISAMLFPVSAECSNHLAQENVLGRVILSGDTMFEIYQKSFGRI